MPRYAIEVFVDDDSEGTFLVTADTEAEAIEASYEAVRDRSLRCTIREATDEDDEFDFDYVLPEDE